MLDTKLLREQRQFLRNWSQLIQTTEIISFHDVFHNILDKPIITKKTMKSDASTQTEHGQGPTMINSEPTLNVEAEIDNKKSDEQMHQFVKSVETEKID